MDKIANLFVENLVVKKVTLPAGSIGNAQVPAGASVDADKLQGEYRHRLAQTGTVVVQTDYVTVIQGSTASIRAVQAAITEVLATDAGRTVTIDLLKSTGGGAFATILTTPLVLHNTDALRTVTQAVVANPDLVAGDILKLTVAVAGSSGAQAQGLAACVTWKEDAF